jgi:hypothetical protein
MSFVKKKKKDGTGVIMLSKISQAQKDKYRIFPQMQNIDLKKNNNMTRL